MSFDMDPQVMTAMAPILAIAGDAPPPPAGDWKTRRLNVDALLGYLAGLQETPDDVSAMPYEATSADGSTVSLRWYTKNGSAPGSAVVYFHGGGMILGSVEIYEPIVKRYVSLTGVPMLAVDYRLAPEDPHPAPVEDCYAGLRYLADHAADLGVDESRLAVMGDSAGGGLAAGVALLARERGVALARQVLIYPMLDDRTTTPDPHIAPFAVWTYDDNITGWGALLGVAAGGSDTPESAAPARASDLAGLAPAYIEVGELDIFRDEDIVYARRLGEAGVSVEFHLHAGVPHAFEAFAPDADVAQRAVADRIRVLQAL